MRRPREYIGSCLGIADLGVDHDIWQVIVEPLRVLCGRGLRVGHDRQRLEFDDHLFGGILGL